VRSAAGKQIGDCRVSERPDEPVDRPIIRLLIDAVATTYELARNQPEMAAVMPLLAGQRVNHFTRVAASPED